MSPLGLGQHGSGGGRGASPYRGSIKPAPVERATVAARLAADENLLWLDAGQATVALHRHRRSPTLHLDGRCRMLRAEQRRNSYGVPRSTLPPRPDPWTLADLDSDAIACCEHCAPLVTVIDSARILGATLASLRRATIEIRGRIEAHPVPTGPEANAAGLRAIARWLRRAALLENRGEPWMEAARHADALDDALDALLDRDDLRLWAARRALGRVRRVAPLPAWAHAHDLGGLGALDAEFASFTRRHPSSHMPQARWEALYRRWDDLALGMAPPASVADTLILLVPPTDAGLNAFPPHDDPTELRDIVGTRATALVVAAPVAALLGELAVEAGWDFVSGPGATPLSAEVAYSLLASPLGPELTDVLLNALACTAPQPGRPSRPQSAVRRPAP